MIPPLLVIDGDSFAHRSYHALPKTIRRRGNRGGGAIVGFANFLLRLYESEQPRAVLVGWDTLVARPCKPVTAPTPHGRDHLRSSHFDALLQPCLVVVGGPEPLHVGCEAVDGSSAKTIVEEAKLGCMAINSLRKGIPVTVRTSPQNPFRQEYTSRG